jgi:fructose-specific phosphotransferase system IIC component
MVGIGRRQSIADALSTTKRMIASYIASRKLAFLVDHAVVSGLIFGALVYFFMHWVVLPLSAASLGHMPLIYQACEFVEHWFCVGLPIALSVRHYSHPRLAR